MDSSNIEQDDLGNATGRDTTPWGPNTGGSEIVQPSLDIPTSGTNSFGKFVFLR